MNRVLAAVLLAAAPKAFALEGAHSFDTGFSMPALSFQRAAATPARVGPHRPRIATITGGMNLTPVDLTFDRVEWTIKGGIAGSPVDVKIDHDKAKITGGANQSPIDLTFKWSPEAYSVEGGANLSPIKLDIDWQKGTLNGYANHSTVAVTFNLEEGWVKGAANHSGLELKYDKISGKLTGGMNQAPVGVTLTNMDLSDFLQNFFLFLRQP